MPLIACFYTPTRAALLLVATTCFAAGCSDVGVSAAGVDASGHDATSDGAADAVDVKDSGPGQCQAAADCPPPSSPCRKAVCEGGQCGAIDRPDQLPCEDGDLCTAKTVCQAGQCGGGAPVACDDGNPCTLDSCSPLVGCQHGPANEGGDCDDADPCTDGDSCVGGSCVGAPAERCACDGDTECAALDDANLCNGSFVCTDGTCRVDPATVIECPASGPCRDNVCVPATGKCSAVLASDGAGCDDANPCSTDDACFGGTCGGQAGACACNVDADCKVFQQPGYNLCLGPLVCISGVCVADPAKAVVCEDPIDNPCAVSVCEPGTGLCGLVAAADGTTCETGDPCAPSGSCKLGACVAPPPDCDDGNPCTKDSCAADAGCVHTAIGGACDDGDPCTAGDACQDGVCIATKAACDDGNPCTVDSCDAADGACTSTPIEDGDPCGGGLCVEGGTCQGGECVDGQPVACDDGNPCTDDSCHPDLGCLHVPSPEGSACEDGEPCTQTGECVGGGCEALPKPCNDGNPCTIDGCTEGLGCTHEPAEEGAACDPADACLTDGECKAGQCVGGIQVECDDVPCEIQACDSTSGQCVPVDQDADGTPCDDGSPCTGDGTCYGGSCEGLEPVDCDDADPCTADTCDETTGECAHAPVVCDQPADDACQEALCDAVVGCTSVKIPICQGEKVVWQSTLPCGDDAGWSFDIDAGVVGFAIDASPDPPAAFEADGCSLNLNDGEGYGSTDAPTAARAASPGFAVDATGPTPVSVSFREWVDVDPAPDVDRRFVALVDPYGTVVDEVELPAAGDGLAWEPHLVVLTAGSPGAHRVVFRFDSVEPVTGDGAGWFVDRVIVTTPN